MQHCTARSVVVHVEDHDATAYLFQVALRGVSSTPQLFHVADGVAASMFLAKHHPFEEAPKPNLVLIDLNLPGKDGFELISEVRAHPEHKGILLVVFSTSNASKDRSRGLGLGADDYICKPETFEGYIDCARHVCALLAGRFAKGPAG